MGKKGSNQQTVHCTLEKRSKQVRCEFVGEKAICSGLDKGGERPPL